MTAVSVVAGNKIEDLAVAGVLNAASNSAVHLATVFKSPLAGSVKVKT